MKIKQLSILMAILFTSSSTFAQADVSQQLNQIQQQIQQVQKIALDQTQAIQKQFSANAVAHTDQLHKQILEVQQESATNLATVQSQIKELNDNIQKQISTLQNQLQEIATKLTKK